ncbi:TPA: hypothetical protein ACKQHR_001558 [Pseudomonas aeruginosa]|nr:hypothetical protein [Pseudomonas aeruginosa]EIU2864425.1 hypothetical protein [Pseudomonas aeruginosa]
MSNENAVVGCEKVRVKTVAFVTDSNGSPDFFYSTVEVTQDEYDLGMHYDVITQSAEDQGYEVEGVFDEKEPAARKLAELAQFLRASSESSAS